MRQFGSLRKNGQTAIEFAMVAAVVVAALMAISVYFSRSIQGRIRIVADGIGEQYDPASTSSDIATTQRANIFARTHVEQDNLDGTEILATHQNSETRNDRTRKLGEETVHGFGSIW